MGQKTRIHGNQYYLETLIEADVSIKYVNWLNDPKINSFLEVRFVDSNISNTKEFVRRFNNKDSYIFGIYVEESKEHIGNMALYIDSNHDVAHFGFFIGVRAYWGKQASMEACYVLFDFAFNHLRLRKIWGSVYNNNIGSIFNYKLFGFIEEARLREHSIHEGLPVDALIFSMLNKEWHSKKSKLAEKLRIKEVTINENF